MDSLSAPLSETSEAPGTGNDDATSTRLTASMQTPRQKLGIKDRILRDIERKNFAGAIAGLQTALAVKKKDPVIIRWLVAVANDADDLFLARKYVRKLVDVEPQEASNHVFHGTILDRLGKFDEAIKAYRKADRLRPGYPKTLLALGKAYGASGDHAEALKYYEKALESDPYNDAAMHSAAQAKKYTESEALELVERVDAAIPHVEEGSAKARLHFTAGKVLDDAKRYDEAFARFKTANDMVRPEDPQSMLRAFSNIKETFPDAAFFEERRELGSSNERPIFILGMPRSGTTLTESVCASHSLVTAGDEQNAIGPLAAQLGRDRPGNPYARMIAALGREHITAFADAYIEHCEQTVGKTTPYFTDKMPHNFLNVGLIALLFPNAPIIHCRRHPLDTCLSLYSKHMPQAFHVQYKTDLRLLGEHCAGYLDLMDHWHKVLPGRVHDIYYEDLVANTEWNARALIDVIGLEWEDNVSSRAASQRRVNTASQWQVRQPVYQSSKGRWRRYESHLGPLIDAIGQDRLDAYEEALAALDRDEK